MDKHCPGKWEAGEEEGQESGVCEATGHTSRRTNQLRAKSVQRRVEIIREVAFLFPSRALQGGDRYSKAFLCPWVPPAGFMGCASAPRGQRGGNIHIPEKRRDEETAKEAMVPCEGHVW